MDRRQSQEHKRKQEFGERLYKSMLAKGWSQSDLAREADIPRDAISRYIRKVSLPEQKNLLRLAQALGVEPDALLPDYEDVKVELADDPPLEIKTSSGDPTMAWIRINRLVKVSMLPKILLVLEEAENS